MTPPDDFNPVIGKTMSIAPGIRRVVAPNPSPMTYRGTNTYLVGEKDIAVIDPGPMSDAHLNAILESLSAQQSITHIFVTHAHLDHSPLAQLLSAKTSAPTYAFGPATAGRSDIMQKLAAYGEVGGGEGIDTRFVPDVQVADGDSIEGTGWSLDVLHTPGHIGNHICLRLGDTCFTADHVMGWATSLVSPPDGDLTDFMASCAKMQKQDWSVFYPGHGAPVENPNARLDWLVAHRQGRETQIINALRDAPGTADTLATRIYSDVPEALLPAAARNVLAHLIDLYSRGIVETDALSKNAEFSLKK